MWMLHVSVYMTNRQGKGSIDADKACQVANVTCHLQFSTNFHISSYKHWCGKNNNRVDTNVIEILIFIKKSKNLIKKINILKFDRKQ